MKPIRRGDTIRVGPIRIEVSMNIDGRCEIHTIYGTKAHLGRSYVDASVLEELRKDATNYIHFVDCEIIDGGPLRPVALIEPPRGEERPE